jgi:NADPH:quinone reductase
MSRAEHDRYSALLSPAALAHPAVFADGPVHGLAVLVYGATGGVGSTLRNWPAAAAEALAIVQKDHQLPRARRLGAHYAFLADR